MGLHEEYAAIETYATRKSTLCPGLRGNFISIKIFTTSQSHLLKPQPRYGSGYQTKLS